MLRTVLRNMLMAGAVSIAGTASALAVEHPGDQPLMMAADVGFAPFAMQNPSGGYEGFSIDVGKEIAKRLGRPGVKLIDQDWSGIFAGLYAKRYELIIAPTTITAERSEKMAFTEGYMSTALAFLSRSGAGVADFAALKGKTIAVNNGSTSDTWATENAAKHGYQVQRYTKLADGIQAVMTKRADAALADLPAVGHAASKQAKLMVSLVVPTGKAFGLAFRPEDVEFRNKVEGILECMKFDGTLVALNEKWLKSKPASGSEMTAIYTGFGPPGYNGYSPDNHVPNCK